VDVVHAAVPGEATATAEQPLMSAPFAWNSAVPVGVIVTALDTGVMVAVKVNGRPNVVGLAEEATVVVLRYSAVDVIVSGDDEEGASLAPSPGKEAITLFAPG
jgi:hypothetical protein